MNWVILSTHRDDRGRSLEALTDRFSDRSLTHARRTGQQEHHTLLRVDALVFGDELEDSLLSLNHAIVAVLEDLLGVMHIPERILSRVPGEPEYVIEEGDFSGSFHVVLVLKTVDLFLEDLASRLWHVDNEIEFLLVLGLVALLVVLQHALVGMLE